MAGGPVFLRHPVHVVVVYVITMHYGVVSDVQLCRSTFTKFIPDASESFQIRMIL